MTDRLYRSPTDRVIAGVAGGLAVWLNIDPSLVRIAWVLLAIFSGGIFLLVYFVMMIVVPLPPDGWIPRAGGAPGGTPGGWGTGWGTPGGTAGTSGTAPDAPPAGPTSGWAPPAGGGWSSAPPPATGWSRPMGGGNAGIVLGVVLIVLGAWFLVDQYVRIDWNLLWPAVVIVIGVGLIAAALRRGRPGGSG